MGKQAGRNWTEHLTNTLIQICGMTQCQAEPCVFYKRQGEEFVSVIVWVDDTFWIYNSEALYKSINGKLNQVYESSSSEDEILGMNFIENNKWNFYQPRRVHPTKS